jgi:hypothetical protein
MLLIETFYLFHSFLCAHNFTVRQKQSHLLQESKPCASDAQGYNGQGDANQSMLLPGDTDAM